MSKKKARRDAEENNGWEELRDSGLLETPEGERWHMLVVEHIFLIDRPRILAEKRRRAGDMSASLDDYACSCLTPRKELSPVCLGLRPGCRLANGLGVSRPMTDGALTKALKFSEDIRIILERGLEMNLRYLRADRRGRAAQFSQLRRAVAVARRRAQRAIGPRLLSAPLTPCSE